MRHVFAIIAYKNANINPTQLQLLPHCSLCHILSIFELIIYQSVFNQNTARLAKLLNIHHMILGISGPPPLTIKNHILVYPTLPPLLML